MFSVYFSTLYITSLVNLGEIEVIQASVCISSTDLSFYQLHFLGFHVTINQLVANCECLLFLCIICISNLGKLNEKKTETKTKQ